MPVYAFGPFVLDSGERRLTREGDTIALTGKAFEVLEILAEAGGRLVTRETLYTRLWPDTVVEERTLTVHISTLRKTLTASGPVDYVETVPRAGYRLTAPVRQTDTGGADTAEPATAAAPEVPPPWRSLRAYALAAAVVAGLLLAGVVLYRRDLPADASEPRGVPAVTLAVLPFTSLGLAEDDRYLGLGIADAVITQLSGLPSIGVRPTSAIRDVANGADSAEVGRTLHVASVLEGAIQRDGDQLRITVRLVDTESGTTRWGQSFEQPVANAFALQDAIAQRVAGVLVPRLAAEETATLQSYRPRSAEAYRLQLQARVNLAKVEREPAFKAVEQFQQAIALDPDYALAYAGLASAYRILTSTTVTRALSVEDGVRLAREAAERALALDPKSGEASAVLAGLKFVYDWDWTGAETAFRRALAVAPNSADASARYGWFLAAMGRDREALARLQRARKLDPLRRDTIEMLGFVQWMAGDAGQGLATLAEASAMDPRARRPYFRRMLILDSLGRQDEAMAERAGWLERFDEAQWAKEIVQVYHAKGYRTALEPWLRMLGRLGQAYELAMQWMALGETDKALASLARCLDEHCAAAPFLRAHPTFRPLHDDPRFQALLDRLHLPPPGEPVRPSAIN